MTPYIYQDFMKSDGLDISKFMWQVMAYIYQGLYDEWWLIYIEREIYIKSDGLYISRFIWEVMANIYQGLYEK